MNTATLIQSTVQARADLLATALSLDPHLTPEGLRARQRREVDAIRGRITAAMPVAPTAPDRQPILDALAPKGADDIALQAHQWSKVRALLDAGRDLPSIIRDADRVRLAAILDALETMPEVLEDSQPETVVEFIQGAVWDRLVQVDPAAERIAAIERTNAPAVAWRTILEGLAATGEIPFDGLVLLREADAEAFDLLMDGDALAAPAPESGSIPRLVESLAATPVDA
ncbi:hypothetical protein IT882_15170 [Microbacterium schleiferi]|uniref:Uncharacterized protein n=1 Tax=Microbacterium schleiferi TaxID=69362 RepID=A0A7S8MY18_9MICO|nr:hypothetical protein [Microbacterium schleiferi]QPE04455.1 hypothetical protein IT882_15170 [Microbacterium schleiferi]